MKLLKRICNLSNPKNRTKLVFIGAGLVLAIGAGLWFLFLFQAPENATLDGSGTGGGGDPCYYPTCRCPDGSCSLNCCDTSTSVELVDEVLRGLAWGNIVFNSPSTMRYKQSQLVELLLSPSLSVAQLQAQLEHKAGAESANVRISNRMEAQLTGRGFAIEALMPDLQAVASEQVSRWRWNVTPTEHGSQRLHLVLSAHIDVAGRDTPLVVRTFDRTIEVEITIPQRVSGFIQGNWQWLWAAVLVPIAGYIWRRWKKGQDKPNHGAA